jgi:hypothetical protein
MVKSSITIILEPKFLPFSNDKAVQTSWSQKQAVTYLKIGCSLQVFAKQQLGLLMAQALL